jgi:hypothetical protein
MSYFKRIQVKGIYIESTWIEGTQVLKVQTKKTRFIARFLVFQQSVA